MNMRCVQSDMPGVWGRGRRRGEEGGKPGRLSSGLVSHRCCNTTCRLQSGSLYRLMRAGLKGTEWTVSSVLI